MRIPRRMFIPVDDVSPHPLLMRVPRRMFIPVDDVGGHDS
jgi:hypothetical protein